MRPICVLASCDCHGGTCYGCRNSRRSVSSASERGVAAPEAEAPRGALGNHTDFITPLGVPPSLPDSISQIESYASPVVTKEGNLHEWEAVNWLSLSHARAFCVSREKVHRLASCGVSLNHNSRFVGVLAAPGVTRAKVTGICRCGQTLCCPVCSPRAAAYRAEEVADGYKNAIGQGLDAYLVTLTVPHFRGSPLLDEAMWWRDSWSWAFGQAGGKSAYKAKENWQGYVNACEMTWSEAAGWHFHRHLLLFVDQGFGPLTMAMMRARWLAAIRRGKRDNGGIEKYAFDARPCCGKLVAYYVSKIGAEVSASTTTKASDTPLSMLRRAALAGDFGGRDSELWYEALTVCSGLKLGSVRWSRGLRAALGLPPSREDSELAEDTATQADTLLGYVTPDQWRRIIGERLEYTFLQAANAGLESANLFLWANSLGILTTPKEYQQTITHTRQ